jgi:hypothetical protein
MSDWQVGDLAVCVDDTQQCRVETGELTHAERKAGLRFLVRGRGYIITRIVEHWTGRQGVFIQGQPVARPYAADRFAKLRPDAHEKREEEFVTLLKRSRKRVSA